MYLQQPCFANITEFIGKRCYKYIAVHQDTGVSRYCANTVSKVIHFVTIAICTKKFSVCGFDGICVVIVVQSHGHAIVREDDKCNLML